MWSRLDPFRLPVHAPLVHFPVALLTLVWGMLLLRYVTGDERWDERARLLHAIAALSLPFVLAAALIDTRGFEFVIHAQWNEALIWHALVGLVVALMTVGHFFWRRRYTPAQLTGRLAVADLAIASVAFWGLVVLGLLAGEMVFGQ
jgi:uncharacterized membrane protein